MKANKLRAAAECELSKWQPISVKPTKRGFYHIKSEIGCGFENTGKYTWGYWKNNSWSFYVPYLKEKFDPNTLPSLKQCNGFGLIDGDQWRGLV